MTSNSSSELGMLDMDSPTVTQLELLRLKRERDELASQLNDANAENDAKDALILSLREQLDRERWRSKEFSISGSPPAAPSCCPRGPVHRSSPCSSGVDSCCSTTSYSTTASSVPRELSVRDAVEEIQRWLFMEGGHLMGVEEMVAAYCSHVRSKLGVPVDRLFIGGLMLHPQLSAYVWKWEHGQDFDGHEIPRDIFEKKKSMFSPDEPFIVLMDGRAEMVRMQARDEHIPKDCEWFQRDGYQDYIALPLQYRGKFVGAIGWSTKTPGGFTDKDVQFFERSLAALSTVMRLHTNDLVMKTLMGRLEDEVAERTQELEKANSRLEAANKRVLEQSANQLFHFAMASHEIRTPLNCIVAMSSLLLDEGNVLPEHQRETVRMITSSGDLLAGVVNDVLDFASLESGKVDIALEPTNLQDTINVVIQAMEIKGRPRGQTIRCDQIDFSVLPRVIETDAMRLQQVLFNLIGNSIKFSKDGGIVDLFIEICDDDEGDVCFIEFRVKDYGRGIAPKNLAKIFKPFEQGCKETQKMYGGTGLGLAIAQRLVKGMNGSMSADSVLGQWTEVVVTLPQNRDSLVKNSVLVVDKHDVTKPPGDHVPAEQVAHLASNSKEERFLQKGTASKALCDARVLVADDNLVNQKILRRVLQRLGLQHIDVVSNGQEAVDKEKANTYDCVLMDVQMPVLDGIETTRAILARERCAKAPSIVFVTAHALETFRQDAVAAGGCDFISKPFNLQKIKAVFDVLGYF